MVGLARICSTTISRTSFLITRVPNVLKGNLIGLFFDSPLMKGIVIHFYPRGVNVFCTESLQKLLVYFYNYRTNFSLFAEVMQHTVQPLNYLGVAGSCHRIS